MSQESWIRGPICGVDNCRSRLYKRAAGRKFCQFGHVTEGEVDIEEDDNDAFTVTRRLNLNFDDSGFGSQVSSKGAPVGILQRSGKEVLQGKERQNFVFKCHQYILRKIFPMVIRHLYRDLGDEALRSLAKSLEPILKLFWIRCVKLHYNNTLITVLDLYVLVFLALRHLNRYPVFIDKYIEMMSLNKVPVYNAYKLLPPDMFRHIPRILFWLFAATEAPYEDLFYIWMSRLSIKLKVPRKTPTSFSYPLAFKMFTDLRIPHAPQLLASYYELSKLFTKGAFTHRGSDALQTLPEAQTVGLVHYILRLYLLESSEILDTTQWVKWLCADDEFPYFDNRIHRMTTKQVINLSDEKISRYLDWVHDNVLEDKAKDIEGESISPTQAMQAKLAKIFNYLKSNDNDDVTDSYLLFPVVKNNLSSSELSHVEHHLEKYLCSKFGMRLSMLNILRDNIELKLVRRNFASYKENYEIMEVTDFNTNES